MRFSFLIPVYNSEKYIAECLDSILAQKTDDYEIVVVDDGSIDRSYDICKEYQQQYSIINVIQQENNGPFATRRECARHAKGDYLVYVDSDDMVAENTTLELGKVISEFQSDYIIFNYEYFSDVGNRQKNKCRNITGSCIDKNDLYLGFLKREIPNGLCGKVFSRELMDLTAEYSKEKALRIGEDFLQNLPIITGAKKAFYLNKVLYSYRITPDSLSRSFKYEYIESLNIVNRYLDKYISIWNIDAEGLAAGRYLYDIYDLLRYAYNVRSHDVMDDVLSLLLSGENRNYYREKYRIADKKYMDFTSKTVSMFLYLGLKKILMAYFLLLLPAIHAIEDKVQS